VNSKRVVWFRSKGDDKAKRMSRMPWAQLGIEVKKRFGKMKTKGCAEESEWQMRSYGFHGKFKPCQMALLL